MRVMQLTNSSFWKMLSTCNITTSTKPTKRDNLSFLRCVIFPFWAKDPQLECWPKLQPIYTALALYSHENLFLGKLRDSPKKEILRLTKKERLRIDGLLRIASFLFIPLATTLHIRTHVCWTHVHDRLLCITHSLKGIASCRATYKRGHPWMRGAIMW